MVKVALVKGERSVETVEKAIELAGGLGGLTGKPVLVKPNLIAVKTWETGATTDPMVVEALIRQILPINSDVSLVESDATMTNAQKAVAATGLDKICQKYGVPFINLRHVERVKVKPPHPEKLSEVTLPRLVLESHVVSAAKLKTHSEVKVTLGLKNMFGLLPDKLKAKYHLMGVEKVLLDVLSIVRPAFTVIDGFVGLEGRGPVHGKPVKMDLVIAGSDPVATDTVAAEVMGFDPSEVYHIRRAHELGYGTMTDIEIIGETVEAVRRVFMR